MVNLTRIYTRAGDAGMTRLTDNSVVPKTDPRVNAYGHVDELNSAIGLLLAQFELDDQARAILQIIQNELFDLGADLSTPVVANPKYEPLRIVESSLTRLEEWCDQFNAELPSLRSFVLPGGTPASAHLHVSRTVVRRAERATWAALAEHADSMNPLTATYLNRLSDLLFVLARYANSAQGDVLWKPGGERG